MIRFCLVWPWKSYTQCFYGVGFIISQFYTLILRVLFYYNKELCNFFIVVAKELLIKVLQDNRSIFPAPARGLVDLLVGEGWFEGYCDVRVIEFALE